MRFLFSLSLFFAVLSFSFAFDFHSPYKTPPVNPPSHAHPRLMFRESDIAQIKENMRSDQDSAAAVILQKDSSNMSKNVSFVPLKNKTYTFDGKVISHIENAAFLYALEKDPKYVSFAYDSFIRCCDTFNAKGIYDTYRPAGQMMLTAAELYDWCYDALSSKQKKEIITRALSFAQLLEIGCPPSKQGAVVGHGCEAQLLRSYIALAIAAYDERPEIWNYCAGRFYQEYVPARLFYYNTGVPSFQGSNYGPYRTVFDIWAALLIMRMGCENPYGDSLSLWNDSFLYYQRPDGQMWRLGDDTGERHDPYELSTYANNAFFSSAVSGNQFVKYFASSFYKNFTLFKYNTTGESDDHFTPVQFILFNNPSVVPVSYTSDSSSLDSQITHSSQLPLARYNPSPLGEYFARGSWNDKNTPAVHMKIGELNTSNHEHRDGGTFEIFCGGILVSDSGYYTSGTNYGTDEVRDYLHGTIAHNCLLVEPPAVTQKEYGGQKTVSDSPSLSLLLADKNAVRGKVTAHEYNAKYKYAYLSGDLTSAYEYAESVQRSMLALFTDNSDIPLLFFVYDSVVPKKDSRAVFLLHMQSEPSVNGNTVSFANDSARLYSTTLLPLKPVILKIGGKGNEFMIAGKNFAPAIDPSSSAVSESGWGRIEIRDASLAESRKTAAEKSCSSNQTSFFHAMTVRKIVSENSVTAPELLQSDLFDGAYICETAVFFAKQSAGKPKSFDLDIPASTHTVCVCNIVPGTYTVTGQGTSSVSSEGKILFLKADNVSRISAVRVSD